MHSSPFFHSVRAANSVQDISLRDLCFHCSPTSSLLPSHIYYKYRNIKIDYPYHHLHQLISYFCSML
ncbi:hypothetical protein FKM82_019260 [Ascaphus truei]